MAPGQPIERVLYEPWERNLTARPIGWKTDGALLSLSGYILVVSGEDSGDDWLVQTEGPSS